MGKISRAHENHNSRFLEKTFPVDHGPKVSAVILKLAVQHPSIKQVLLILVRQQKPTKKRKNNKLPRLLCKRKILREKCSFLPSLIVIRTSYIKSCFNINKY